MSRFKVGVSALFDPADTPHARTFLRAMSVARNGIPGFDRVHWQFCDDGANAERAAQVARQMVAAKVDLVIGHFSSDAAMVAANIYRQAGIGLLSPAATIDCLTQDNPNVFRFCPADRHLAKDLVAWLRRRQWNCVHIDADPSAHGQALAKVIAQAASDAGIRRTIAREQAQVEVFAGRLASSREHWHARRRSGSQRALVLTDDAASPYLGNAAAQDANTYVIGFGASRSSASESIAHHALFGAAPETYWRESLLMFHVLAQLARRAWRPTELLHALNHQTFTTPLGPVSFDQGECRGARIRLWQVGPTGLMPIAD
ncbi:ABC transporter substrate-binding protein [Pseudomonas syringae]|uniref:ABC transporter n=1 Tax=Pseudomonas syringae TaxID=317 RepID=A0A085V652_PSESX|nr:ABC transporter substrate-binding protein [Pseudomonas syringae]KFE50915.1 ABC transporter [Pseudomonas syringae]